MKTIIIFLLILFPVLSQAQTDQHKEITKPIYDLFDGFKTGDSAKVAAAFFDRTPYLGTSFVRNDVHQFREDAGLDGLLKVIANPKPDSLKLDERIYDLKVQVDDGLASVFCPYSFYVGKNFSHCGVNFFTLTLTDKGWKILSIVDTRRRDKCLK